MKSLSHIEIDPHSLPAPNPQIDHERRLAVYDLIEDCHFVPVAAKELGIEGPFKLHIGFSENRLILGIEADCHKKDYLISVASLRTIIKDYAMICASYEDAIRQSTPAQIEAIDMGRRGIHNEGAQVIRDRLKDKIDVDHQTARALFTLFYSLHLR
jgi:uncharacterized protein (UPF0262 family)